MTRFEKFMRLEAFDIGVLTNQVSNWTESFTISTACGMGARPFRLHSWRPNRMAPGRFSIECHTAGFHSAYEVSRTPGAAKMSANLTACFWNTQNGSFIPANNVRTR